ncbi:MAG: hypothetical protein J6J44_05510 [Lachnospiraceae bacterium]|nr:hypothetical protein [Lachnospiraceae bacterium]
MSITLFVESETWVVVIFSEGDWIKSILVESETWVIESYTGVVDRYTEAVSI